MGEFDKTGGAHYSPEGDIVIDVTEPGQPYNGTFTEALQEVFGATEETIEAASEQTRGKMQLIDASERRAAIHSREIIIY